MDKVLPNSLEAERSTLGSLLISPTLIHGCIEKLPYDAFHGSHNKEIYKAITDMEDNEQTPDVLTLAEYLRKKDKLEDAGGVLYLSELVENVSTAANIDAYIDILIEKHKLRMAITDLSGIVNTAFQPEADIDLTLKQIDVVQESIQSVGSEKECVRHHQGRIARIGEYRSQVRDYYDSDIEEIGTPFGEWPIFSKHFRVVPGTLNVISGIPGHGKTTLSDQIITNLIIEKGFKCGMFSAEGIPYLHIKSFIEKMSGRSFFGNDLSSDLFNEFFNVLDSHVFLLSPSRKNCTPKSLIKLAKQAKEEHGIDIMLIDPWNKLIHDHGSQRTTLYIRDTLRELLYCALELNVALFVVAHPKMQYKKPNTNKYSVPTLYELEESAHWFNCMDNGMTVFRHFDPGGDWRKEYIEVHIQKIKEAYVYGRIGVCYFRYSREAGGKLIEITREQAKAGDVPVVFNQVSEPEPVQMHYADEL